MRTPTTGTRRRQLAYRWRESYLGACWRRSDALDLPTAALALGAQEVLCTAPLFVALSAVIVRFRLGYVGGFLDDMLGLDVDSARAVRELFDATRAPDLGSLWFGLATTVVFYVAVAATTQRTVDAIWNLPPAGWSTWWRRLAWVAVQVPVFAVTVNAGGYLHRWHLGESGANMAYAAALGLGAGLFHWWGHHFLTGGRISRRDLLPGSVAIGVGTLVLVLASPLVMPSQISDNVADYGLIGAAFILSLWSVTYSAIVVFGTLMGQVYVSRGGFASRVTTRRNGG